ncbi:MAG TPA: RNase adapter RapZ [Usitatibacteraceae bacterium]|nr:RNase adapter RapZ [Usitatibacteraceae bacterium]
MQLTLLSGVSGSGKSVALKALEDSGYFCVDNIPPNLIRGLVSYVASHGEPRVAVSADARSADTIGILPQIVEEERANGIDVRLVFLDATDASIVRRFAETRRPHPLAGEGRTLEEALAIERALLAPIAEMGHRVDTSSLTPVQLRGWIHDLLVTDPTRLALCLESFGFKGGVPLNADFVFDARFLPNPYYDPQLRPKSGLDPEVAEFLERETEAGLLLEDIHRFVVRWLPRFTLDRRAALTIAIGCTGGRHRSVYLVEKLAERLRPHHPLIVRHRDLGE